MAEKKTCFIITPIGEEGSETRQHIDDVIDEIVIPAFQDKYEIIPPHRINKIGSITEDTLEYIRSSDLVVANLTGLNPNVMYELGYRHCVGKPVIAIAEKGTKPPFDIQNDRTFYYEYTVEGIAKLREQLVEVEGNIDMRIGFSQQAESPWLSLRTSDRRHWCGNPFSLLLACWGVRIATLVCAPVRNDRKAELSRYAYIDYNKSQKSEMTPFGMPSLDAEATAVSKTKKEIYRVVIIPSRLNSILVYDHFEETIKIVLSQQFGAEVSFTHNSDKGICFLIVAILSCDNEDAFQHVIQNVAECVGLKIVRIDMFKT